MDLKATINYNITTNCEKPTVNVTIKDRDGLIVAFNQNMAGSVSVISPNLWWPRFMKNANNVYGYLYSFTVTYN